MLTNNLLLPVDDDSDADSNTLLKRDRRGLVPVRLWLVYVTAAASRYCFHHRIYRMRDFHSTMPMWQQIVEGYKYNEEEFLQHFCCPRQMFQWLVQLLRDHPSISYDPIAPVHQCQHMTPEHHLLVTLKYLGSEGNGANALNVKEGLGVSKGSILNYVNRGVAAILSLGKDCYFWPDAEECKEISVQIKQKFNFPHCVGYVNGIETRAAW